jgi:hypothetical protein
MKEKCFNLCEKKPSKLILYYSYTKMVILIEYLHENKFNGIEDINKIKKELYKKNVTVSYDKEVYSGTRRVIFTHAKTSRNKTQEDFMEECNGLILQAPTWNPLCIPLPSPKTNYKPSLVNQLLDKQDYKIFKMNDGTTINMYHYNDKWVLSSTHGIEINNLSFTNLNYQTILQECLAKVGLEYEEFLRGDWSRCISTILRAVN